MCPTLMYLSVFSPPFHSLKTNGKYPWVKANKTKLFPKLGYSHTSHPCPPTLRLAGGSCLHRDSQGLTSLLGGEGGPGMFGQQRAPCFPAAPAIVRNLGPWINMDQGLLAFSFKPLSPNSQVTRPGFQAMGPLWGLLTSCQGERGVQSGQRARCFCKFLEQEYFLSAL